MGEEIQGACASAWAYRSLPVPPQHPTGPPLQTASTRSTGRAPGRGRRAERASEGSRVQVKGRHVRVQVKGWHDARYVAAESMAKTARVQQTTNARHPCCCAAVRWSVGMRWSVGIRCVDATRATGSRVSSDWILSQGLGFRRVSSDWILSQGLGFRV